MRGSILLISAGIGSPAECELAVDKMLEFLGKSFRVELLERSEGRSGYARSVLLASPDDLSEFEGAVQWQCPSPLRPGHKRKNWFIKATLCRMDEPEFRDFDERLVEFSTCRASGPGGQHVNKTESAVRAVCPPLGLCGHAALRGGPGPGMDEPVAIWAELDGQPVLLGQRAVAPGKAVVRFQTVSVAAQIAVVHPISALHRLTVLCDTLRITAASSTV